MKLFFGCNARDCKMFAGAKLSDHPGSMICRKARLSPSPFPAGMVIARPCRASSRQITYLQDWMEELARILSGNEKQLSNSRAAAVYRL